MGKNAQIRQKPKRTRIEQRKSEGIAFAVARNIRISPRKVRRVINLIRGKAYQEALAILNFTPTPATEPVRKVLQSAGANADHNLSLTIERLYVKTCFVDAGISFKRKIGRAHV